jgi:hypothetical protein
MENNVQVSLVASATRPMLEDGFRNWDRFYNSLKGNSVNWEVIFVGDVPPTSPMPDNFRWIKSTAKPAQCYEIGFRAAKGETIAWTADDASYNWNGNVRTIDIAYEHYKRMERERGNDKGVVAFRPIEDGGDVYKFHCLQGGNSSTPAMAPFALISRRYLNEELKGYDRRFVSGQSENDVIMRVYETGGIVEINMEAFVYVNHRQVHPKGSNINKFRKHYTDDRKFLEAAWVVEGYGAMDSGRGFTVSKTRLCPLEPFEATEDWHEVSQGNMGKEWDEHKKNSK